MRDDMSGWAFAVVAASRKPGLVRCRSNEWS